MKINHSFQIKSLLKMINPPPPLLGELFAEVKIKNDHMIDKMEVRVKHAFNKYDDVLIVGMQYVI